MAEDLGVTHTPTRNGAGYSLTVPHGKRNVVIRVMEKSRERSNYYRVSIDGKQTFTKAGDVSTNMSLTHVDIEPSSHSDILNILEKVRNEFDKPFRR